MSVSKKGARKGLGLVPGVDVARAEAALRASVPAAAIEANLAVFKKAAGAP